ITPPQSLPARHVAVTSPEHVLSLLTDLLNAAAPVKVEKLDGAFRLFFAHYFSKDVLIIRTALSAEQADLDYQSITLSIQQREMLDLLKAKLIENQTAFSHEH